MFLSQPGEHPDEVDQFVVDVLPVDPGERVVLAVGVVVALLGVAKLIPAEDHRHAEAGEERGEEVALLPGAQRQDVLVVGRAFDAAVPGAVVVVPAFFAVGVVVLLVV